VPNPVWMVNVAVPARLRDQLARRRLHHRQALHEIIREALRALEREASEPP